ncbi:radical SAM protein [Acetivibrio mesophilus]|uniref:Radical SAM protein n=1 Tax=Acetivibrio mesophilus TaxID=2487273 RepID=A0A4Q0IC48_9FIRM|nr:radical SAM protein [Acetivibrio mesophilus]
MERLKKLKIALLEIRNSVTIYKFTLGIHYLTSVLREDGYTVSEMLFEAEEVDSISEMILEKDPDVVGISFYRETEEYIFKLARLLKKAKPNIKVFLGGHTATLYSTYILKKEKNIDIVVNSEGEKTVLDLVNRLEEGRSLETCEGITYRQDDEIIKNKNRELIENLDELPFPAIDVLKEKSLNNNYVFAGISTSRGCMGKCAFCVANRFYTYEKKYNWRGRSPANVVDEILYLKKSFPDKRLFYTIIDSSIEDPDPIRKNRLKELVSLMEKNNIHIPFNCYTRSESWSENDIDLIKRLKNVGLFEVNIGYEGSIEKTLEIFKKRASIDDNYRAYRIFKDENINVFGFLIMFHPYTSFTELRSNAELLLKVEMAYHPQSWWQTMDLWPDSRIFFDVTKDGLLMGPEEKGYIFNYAYEDGRIHRVNAAMKKIGESQESIAYVNTNEKIKLDQLLYNVWKEQDSQLKVIENEMSEYIELYEQRKKLMGICQYEYFMELIDKTERDLSDREIDSICNDWISALRENNIELEKIWLKFNMMFRRKKVELLV